MTTPTLEQMLETYRESFRTSKFPNQQRDGITAVLEKHIGPMLAEAFDEGAEVQFGNLRKRVSLTGHGRGHAARIIEQMKEQP